MKIFALALFMSAQGLAAEFETKCVSGSSEGSGDAVLAAYHEALHLCRSQGYSDCGSNVLQCAEKNSYRGISTGQERFDSFHYFTSDCWMVPNEPEHSQSSARLQVLSYCESQGHGECETYLQYHYCLHQKSGKIVPGIRAVIYPY